MKQIKEILFQRLENKGIDLKFVPGFIRTLANSFWAEPDMTLSQINRRLHYLGWAEVELDYHTWQLTIACLEDCGLKGSGENPAGWCWRHFSPTNSTGTYQSNLAADAGL
jgi:hypothetical protein